MANLAKENGASPSTSFRLDPYQVSHLLNVGNKSYKLDRNGAVVTKTLSCGLEMRLAVPSAAYEGIAARAVEDNAGNMVVTLELMHKDPSLCVPLLFANDMEDIAADWHSWSRLLKLPMLLIGVDGQPTAVQNMLGELMVSTPRERRRRITTVRHRPNFLRRRKMGVVGVVEKLTPADIIARI